MACTSQRSSVLTATASPWLLSLTWTSRFQYLRSAWSKSSSSGFLLTQVSAACFTTFQSKATNRSTTLKSSSEKPLKWTSTVLTLCWSKMTKSGASSPSMNSCRSWPTLVSLALPSSHSRQTHRHSKKHTDILTSTGKVFQSLNRRRNLRTACLKNASNKATPSSKMTLSYKPKIVLISWSNQVLQTIKVMMLYWSLRTE